MATGDREYLSLVSNSYYGGSHCWCPQREKTFASLKGMCTFLAESYAALAAVVEF